MVKKEKPAAVVMTNGKREIPHRLLSEYDIQTAQDIQESLKDLLGGTIKEIMETETTMWITKSQNAPIRTTPAKGTNPNV
ncbi:MAG: hypothetical protein IJK81_02090 [Selenomonadaceae bacterium]|nr:hypothetical protein [Selenomonadaceae bacterium]